MTLSGEHSKKITETLNKLANTDSVLQEIFSNPERAIVNILVVKAIEDIDLKNIDYLNISNHLIDAVTKFNRDLPEHFGKYSAQKQMVYDIAYILFIVAIATVFFNYER